jgi:hypothetical protein
MQATAALKFRRKGSGAERMDSGARPLEKKAAHKHPVAHTHKRCWAEMEQRKRLAVLRMVVRKKERRTAAERMRQAGAGLDMGRWPAR